MKALLNETESYSHEGHISPDGNFILGLKNGLKVYELVKSQQGESNEIEFVDTQWEFPFD